MVYFAMVYGLLTIIGGMVGYFVAGSIISIISGSISGILILLGAKALLKKQNYGYFIILGLSGLLGSFFGFKFFASFSPMPDGLMLLLSAITFVGFLLQKPQLLQKAS